MAFVYKNHLSKFWIAAFRDITGKRRNRSTKLLGNEKTKRQAEKIAMEYESAATRNRTSLQVRRTIADLHKELTGNELLSVTLAAHVETWIASKRTSVADSTMDFYEGTLKRFLDYHETGNAVDLSDITRADIEQFRDELAAKLSPKTVNHNVKVLRMLFRDARERSLLLDDPTEFVKTVKAKSAVERRPFTVEEIRKVIEHCDDEWRSIVLFGLYTGQRLGDIAKLTWESIDLKKKELRLTTAKTGRFLSVPLHQDLVSLLEALPAPISKAMPIHANAASYKRTSNLSNHFAAILVAAGFRDKAAPKTQGTGQSATRTLNQLSFHSLRRTATTLLHEAGVPQSVAMALIGHDSKDIHKTYVNVGEVAMRDASSKLPSVVV
jgi:integrase